MLSNNNKNIITITGIVDDQEVSVVAGASILDACKEAGVVVPRFCFHELLSLSGNCRMCLVEVEGLEKPIASCLTDFSENMVVYTNSLFAKKARESVLETLLVNHPLDCPICDQAGECDLQDETKTFGSNYTKYLFNKRSVEDKDCGPFIKTIMTRCIHCTRCVRFSSEVAGVDFLGTFNRGSATEIGGYSGNFFDSELSGNVIDLCPVGALTSKPFANSARPWELSEVESIDTTDSTCSNILVHTKKWDILRVLPKNNIDINGQLISDNARFSYDSHFSDRLSRNWWARAKENNSFTFGKKDEISISWQELYSKVGDLMTSQDLNAKVRLLNQDDAKNNELILLNEDLGFQNLALIKKSVQKNKSVLVAGVNAVSENVNFYSWNITDKIGSISSCESVALIYSTNPKIECPTLNSKLRTQSLHSLLTFTSSNIYFSSNFENSVVSLNLLKSMSILEGKNQIKGGNFNSAFSSLVLFGEGMKKYGMNVLYCTFYLKTLFQQIKVLKINETANGEALSFLNINGLTRKAYNKCKIVFSLNLFNSWGVRKIVYDKTKKTVWLNTHRFVNETYAKIKRQTNILFSVPILSEYEDEHIFLNTENRPQKTAKVFNKFFDARNAGSVINMFFNQLTFSNSNISKKTSFVSKKMKSSFISKKFVSRTGLSLSFIEEMAYHPEYFQSIENYFNVMYMDYLKSKTDDLSFLYLTPLLHNRENMYLQNKNRNIHYSKNLKEFNEFAKVRQFQY